MGEIGVIMWHVICVSRAFKTRPGGVGLGVSDHTYNYSLSLTHVVTVHTAAK